MWPRLTDLSSIVARLTELAALIRESNALTRELIFAQTKRPATTPRTIHSLPGTPPRPLQRIRTDRDVFRVTQEDLSTLPPQLPQPEPPPPDAGAS